MSSLHSSSKWSMECSVRSIDADAQGRLRLSRLFEWVQELSGDHVAACGYSREILRSRCLFWAVSLIGAEFVRMPRIGENVRLSTWADKSSHGLYPRYTTLSSGSEELIRIACYWTVMDAARRVMVMPGESGITSEASGFSAPLERPKRPVLLPETAKAAFTVPYSMLDTNGHMNNARYFDLSVDHLPEALRKKESFRLSAEYASELKLNETSELSIGLEENAFSLEVKKPGRTAFRLRMDFAE